MSLNQHIQKWATETPDALAVVFGDIRFTFAELNTRAQTAASRLKTRYGINAGDRVTYLGLNHPDVLSVLLACERLGAIFNPLNSRLTATEYSYLLSNAEPTVFLVDGSLEQIAKDIPEAAGKTACIEKLAEGDADNQSLGHEFDEETALLLVYTSGTTGKPKGVVLSQGAVMANIQNCQHLYGFGPGQKVQITLPLFHVGGLCILLLPALTHGATIHLHQRFDPIATLRDIAENKITTSIYVPAQMAAMMSLPDWQTADLFSMKYVVVGSSIIPLKQIKSFHARNIPVSQLYGATETGPAAIGLPVDAALDKEGSAGTVVKYCDIEIRDQNRNVLAEGEHGDIWVRGKNILSHYWRSPDETAKVLVDDWYNTGDVGYVDEKGFYWIVDRSKDVVISGGENIYPAEIELTSQEHPAISAIAVVGRKDKKWGETPVAFVELHKDQNLSLKDYHLFLSDKLAKFKHPKALLIVEQLPRNAMGKIEKSVLRKQINRAD